MTAEPRALHRTTATRLVDVRLSRWLVVAAVVAVAGELAWLAAGVTLGRGPTMPVLPSTVAVPVLLLAARKALPSQPSRAWTPTWVVLGLAGAAAVGWGVASAGLAVTVELAAASFAEEVVYRVGLPVAVAAGLRACRVADRVALRIAVVGSVAVFAVLPGHLAQVGVHGPVLLASFVAMASLWSLAVWATGAVWPAAVAHAVVNTTVLPVEAGTWAGPVRAAVVAVVLLALLWGVHRVQVAAAR